MAGKINKMLYGPAAPGAASALLYTVPANRRTVVRHFHFSNPTGAAITVTCGIGADAAGTRILDAKSIAANDTYDLYGMWPIEAAGTLRAHSSSALMVMTVGGDEEIFA